MEKIKRDSNRVDISKNNSDTVDAGYIIKIDKPTSEEGGCNTCYENSFSFRSTRVFTEKLCPLSFASIF